MNYKVVPEPLETPGAVPITSVIAVAAWIVAVKSPTFSSGLPPFSSLHVCPILIRLSLAAYASM